ncbi:endonuclease NucS domain-containing protein [Herbiconiux sp.]|uniref:endonuclease NucS domain-containing protein n=1 Tax=Herbiconiux sp. TaxID=1871186 RepID=UPI0025C401D8|nr:endonuclease NucS domain-containing protein [Herbiconiux sp.]
MPLYSYSDSGLCPLPRTSFAAEQIRERQDIQRLLLDRIEILGEDLLAIAEEYSLFDDSRRRVDILALDRKGGLVVIELKRTEDGGHMELQALRYVAMVSTITLDHLIETYADAHEVEVSDARQTITNWIDGPIDELANQVRIILVSADFSTEITSTVLWLNDNYGTDISCFRIVAYKLHGEVLLDLQQIIPLPEAKSFQIQQRRKGASNTVNRESGRDFTRYNVSVGSEHIANASKQSAVKFAVSEAFKAGVDRARILEATLGHRWHVVNPRLGESVQDAFVREASGSSPKHRW